MGIQKSLDLICRRKTNLVFTKKPFEKMKFGAAFLISLAAAQDYGLDGADINDAAYSDNYNYDDKDAQNGGITLDDLSSLLADYYGGNTDYSIEDYNLALDELQDSLGTTSSPVTLDAGRPDYDGGADEDEGKQFLNYQDTGSLSAAGLLGSSSTFCWTCLGSGADTAASLLDCQTNGQALNCLNEGEQDYCQVTLRRVNGQIKQIQSRCAQADTCDNIHNFHDQTATKPNRWDQCLPETWDGASWGNSKRLQGRESVCSICHYTSTDYAGANPTTVADDSDSKLRFDGTTVKITGASAEKAVDISSTGFDLEWGQQTNNVLDTMS